MSEHRHLFDRPPSPAAHEDGDFRWDCACGHRQGQLSLTFPYIPPGSNALHRMHHHAVARLRTQIAHDTFYLAELRKEPWEQAELDMEFRWQTNHRRDPGNYVEATKALVDTLVLRRWVVDDSAAHLRTGVHGVTGTGVSDRILVTLTEVTW